MGGTAADGEELAGPGQTRAERRGASPGGEPGETRAPSSLHGPFLGAEEQTMTAKTGERARETGVFHCAVCGAKVTVRQGEPIPECPNGHREFDRRTGEPG